MVEKPLRAANISERVCMRALLKARTNKNDCASTFTLVCA
jgi:hypothetical protein